MLVDFSDEAIRTFSPFLLAEYLVKLGWSYDGTYRVFGDFYRSPSGYRVLVPAYQKSVRYPDLFLHVLQVVARDRDIPVANVIHDIGLVRQDVTHVRVRTRRDSDTLTSEETKKLSEGVDMVWRDALATAIPQKKAQDAYWATGAGVAPMLRGSFVLPLVGPPMTGFQVDLIEDNQVSERTKFIEAARSVTTKLRDALVATRLALDEFEKYTDLDVFVEDDSRGIRVNTFGGLWKATMAFRSVNCEVTFSPLPGIAPPPPSSVTFEASDVAPLRKARDFMRVARLANPARTQFTGYIRTADNLGLNSDEGEVTMRAILRDVEGEQKVIARVDRDQFELASELINKRAYVWAEGVLEQKNTRKEWVLNEATIREVDEGRVTDD